ncbi:MAG: DUF1801 domain-containing protein [Candidatus Nanopelagicales bacterium]
MGQIKTRANDGDAVAFLSGIDNQRRREDGLRMLQMMSEITGEPPVMWGTSIVGFGEQQYTNTTGTNSWFKTGFSPRKASLTVYIMEGFDRHRDQLDRLGPHTHSVSCLYIKDLRKVDEAVLREIITESVEAS